MNLATINPVHGFENLAVISPHIFNDERGSFIKHFDSRFSKSSKCDMSFDVKEAFYSVSKKGVLRGMHFQLPPHDHKKLVYVSRGRILDVVLDMRRGQSSFSRHFSIILDSTNHKILHIPSGFAHGFLSLENDTCVHYMQSSFYDSASDSGVRFDSFGFAWSDFAKEYNISDFIISPRDLSFEPFGGFGKKEVF